MEFENVIEKWTGTVNELTLSDKVKIGGETTFSYHRFEGNCPNRPAVAMEVNDVDPDTWPGTLRTAIGEDILSTPAEWAKKCVEGFGADCVFLDLVGTNQDKENLTADAAADIMNTVLDAVDVPVMVHAAGNADKQNEVFTRCCEAASRQIIIGSASEENYRTVTAAAMSGNHILIAESPIDVNIAKQLNILITQMSFPIERIIIDPLTGGLGYGLEYTYSVMERIRLQTFNSDNMMSPPMLCCVGQDTWKVKEVRLEEPHLGDAGVRGVNWEVATAISLILAGANVVVVRHPESVKQIKGFIDSLFK